ncbi:hypothetical protein [Trujillonella humicola]|uniref:hypothetical protein n=1 Tax=Trujillonella humicola TaxID=3383699 RepID=UPI003906A092
MATRAWTALLLLAAVFAMHGLQCTAAGTDHLAGHGAAPIAVTLAAPGDGGPHPGGLSSGATSAGLEAHGGHHGSLSDATAMATVAAPLVGALTAGHGSAPAGPAGHLWTLCLAVLAVGLAVLLALLLPRLQTLPPAAWARLRTHAHTGLAPLRPPDLHSLCLLRI